MAILLVNLDASAIYLALKQISTDFQSALTTTQWVINTYLLACVICLIPLGRIADLVGRRSIFVLGTSLFLIGSVICAVAPSMPLLLFGRCVQGVGFATLLPLSLVIGAHAFPPEQKNKAIGTLIIFSGIAQAIGPTVGGVILTYLSWRWLFWINLPLCLLGLYLTLKYCVKDKPEHQENFDRLGASLLAPAFFLLIFAANEVGRWGFGSTDFIACIAASIVFFGLYLLRARKANHPLIDNQLFKNRVYLGIILSRLFYMACWSTMLFLLPLFLMMVLNYNVMQAGLIILCSTIVLAITSRCSPLVIKTIGLEKTHYLSLIMGMICFVSFHYFNAKMSAWQLYPTLVLMGLSTGLYLNSSVSGNLQAVEPKRHAISSGLLYTLAFTGSAIGVAFCGAILNKASRAHFIALLQSQGQSMSSAKIDSLHNFLVGTRSLSDLNHALFPANIDQMIQQSFQSGFQNAMLLCSVLSILSLFSGLLCFKKQR